MSRLMLTPRKPKHTVKNGHMEWHGRTRKEAEAARDATLDLLFASYGLEEPLLIVGSQSVMGIVFQRHDGRFAYSVIGWDDAAQKLRQSAPILGSATATKQQAEFSCRRHLAQNLFSIDAGEVLDGGTSVLHPDDKEGRQEHARWVSWQLRYDQLHYEHPDWTHDQLHRAASEATP